MRELKSHARFGLLMSALALASVPSGVFAQETCASDGDCEHGFSCEQFGGDCPAVDCAEGEDCEQVECEPKSVCIPASDCDADADCADGWKCITDERTSCSTAPAEPACAPGEEGECPKPELPPDTPEDCNTETITECRPQWALPCEEAADCGAGFECVERIEMSCSSSGSGGSAGEPTPGADPAPDDGSSGFAPPADGDAALPEEPSCMSEPTGEYYCQLVPTPCETNADCPAGLDCQEQPSDSVCSGGSDDPGAGEGSGSGGAGGSGGDSDAAERPAPECGERPEPTFACAPPLFFSGWGYDSSSDGRGEATSGSGSDTPDSDDGASNGGGEEPPTGAPVDNNGELGGESKDGASMGESSGCSATSSTRSSGGALLMALAVLGLAFRRRSLRA